MQAAGLKNRAEVLITPFTLSLTGSVVLAQERVHTPAVGSPERKAIMDAIRSDRDFYAGDEDAAHRNAKQIFFKVGFLKVRDNWACTAVIPVNAAGKELQDPRWVLFRSKNGRWSDVNCFDALRPFASKNEAQDALSMSAATVRKLFSRFPDAQETFSQTALMFTACQLMCTSSEELF